MTWNVIIRMSCIICWLSTYGNICKDTRPFSRFLGGAWGRGYACPVHNTESDPHWGWLGLTCETVDCQLGNNADCYMTSQLCVLCLLALCMHCACARYMGHSQWKWFPVPVATSLGWLKDMVEMAEVIADKLFYWLYGFRHFKSRYSAIAKTQSFFFQYPRSMRDDPSYIGQPCPTSYDAHQTNSLHMVKEQARQQGV